MEGPDDAAVKQVNPWLVSLAVLAGTFMVVLDTSVVNVSLPHIAGSLSASIEESTWALTSYLAANAVILPLSGWLASYFGRRRLLILSVVGFTTASFLCGMAPTLPVLIGWRIVQGLTGGVMQPLSQAVMLEAFPPHERGKAMAFWGIGIVVAPILGPVLGGWLTDSYSWRWVFYVNVPVGFAAVLLIRAFIFDPSYLRRNSARVDYWGIVLLTLGISALQIGLDRGQEEDWFSSGSITLLIVTATIALSAFLVHALRVRDAVVDLRVFRERSYALGVALITLMGFVMFGSIVLLPLLLQTLMDYSPLQAGYAMIPRGFGTLLVMPVVGALLAKTDPRKILIVGTMGSALTLFWFTWFSLDVGYWDIFWPQILNGVFFGMLFVPLTTTSMDRIRKEDMGHATSMFNLMRNIGGSVGIALTQTLLARQRQVHTNLLGAHVTWFDTASRQMFEGLRATFVARGSDMATATSRAYGAMWGMVQKQAAMLSFLDAFRMLGVLFLVMVPLIVLMRRPEHQRRGAGRRGAGDRLISSRMN